MNRKKSVTFLLPTRGNVGPVGGFKIVYEYANRLVRDGHEVHIVYPLTLRFRQQSLAKKLRALPRAAAWKLRGVSGRSWFPLEPEVREHIVPALCERFVPRTDVYVATAVQTAYYLGDYKREADRLYLIQGYEAWDVSEEYVDSSYRLGLRNIVISGWLRDKVTAAGADCTLIRNAFDFDYFRLSAPIESRNPHSVAMLYHRDERKGCAYGLAALERVREEIPDLKATFFGVPPRPADLPDWIEYYQQPDRETHNRIYNGCSLYLAPSLQEGWGLTVGEAMICGAAVVCTDTLGFREMVTDGENGLIVPTADSEALASAMLKLMRDDNLRRQLASAGNRDIRSFSWENAYSQFKTMIDD